MAARFIIDRTLPVPVTGCNKQSQDTSGYYISGNVCFGDFQFTGEAEAAWLEKQLDKLLEHVKQVDAEDDSQTQVLNEPTQQHKTKETLSAYLKSSNATAN
jgi:hypothetical protein